ncbi:TPA: fimbria/pilus periplasmic chaperone [Escherichia coli]
MKKKIIISLYFISAILSVKNVIAETPVEYPYPETKEIHLHNNKNGQLKGVLQINNPGNKAWLVQTWTEDRNMERSYFIYPSLVRIEPRNKLVLHVTLRKNYSERPNFAFILFIPSGKGINELVVPVAYKLKIELSD